MFFSPMPALHHRLFQFFLVISKQSVNLPMRFVTDRMNLRSKILPRSCRILIEQRLNLIVVLLKQRPDLPMLFPSQLQIFRKASEFLINRLRRRDLLKLLARRGLLASILSYAKTGSSEHEQSHIYKRVRSLSHGSYPPKESSQFRTSIKLRTCRFAQFFCLMIEDTLIVPFQPVAPVRAVNDRNDFRTPIGRGDEVKGPKVHRFNVFVNVS